MPLPQRDASLGVPLPPPSAANAGPSTSHQSAQINFSELDRVNRIGRRVYKVFHRTTGRSFALRVIYNDDESVLRQILREIEILRDVDNPNVVKCHDMYDQHGEIQLLLEYMDGGSLEGKHIPHEPALSELAGQIVRGLLFLHHRKIVHRDIKPSNILINARNQVKIAYFGVSRILAQTRGHSNSFAYTSPERITTDVNHGQYDGYADDVWSLGVSILEFYMGKFPFAVGLGSDWAILMYAICMSQPPEAPPHASREFRNFIACCLQKDPTKRWTAGQLLGHPFITQISEVVPSTFYGPFSSIDAETSISPSNSSPVSEMIPHPRTGIVSIPESEIESEGIP